MPACIRQYRIAAGNPDHYSGFMQFFLCPLVEERIDESRPAPASRRAKTIDHGNGFGFRIDAQFWHGGYRKRKADPERPAKARATRQETRAQEEIMTTASSAGMPRRWRLLRLRMRAPKAHRALCSRGYLLAGVAQHSPIHVRPDVLAAYGAVCGALDGRATLGWHWPDSVAPLAHENRGNSEPLGKIRRRPVCRNVCAKVHSPYISAALKPCQALREFTLLAPGGLRRRKGGFFAPKI